MKEKEKMEKKDEFSITRVFNAPRDLVFKACTEEKHLKEWWGPKGSIIKVHKLEVKPEGIFHYQLTGADGNHMWGKFV
ncbi:MAG TPA: SRPBCC domain-containing protein, partial [Emticicia sp.]